MTVAELIVETRRAGIVLRVDQDHLRVDAPRGALAPALRDTLSAHKPELLAVLWRLEGMLTTQGQRPLAVARLEARGGPGSCFSCGDQLEHPEGYGRCFACDIAADLFYAEQPEDSGVVA